MANEPGKSTAWHVTGEAGTVSAPTFRYPAGRIEDASDGLQTPILVPGERIEDYEIIRPLGIGSFARVYLARQLSLDRQVALKVSPDVGNEARTMASLEHDYVVQVFSETVIAERGIRLLCMQFVPGLTLEHVIAALNERPMESWSGRTIVEILDKLSREPAALDTAALNDRETLRQCDFVEAVCWLGVRLADALAYAHSKGVLHRDIKPANILLNRYGRPYLADFNIASTAQRSQGRELFGGTLSYMAPEHLRAFDRSANVSSAVVDQRSDIYSLGVVLFELLTGRRPFRHDTEDEDTAVTLETLALERSGNAPSVRALRPDVPNTLQRLLNRCLDAVPDRRYDSAGELSQALDGCEQLQRIHRESPAAGPLDRMMLRRPLLALIFVSLIPHVFGSIVNVAYNQIFIVDDLNSVQQTWFVRLVLAYNLVVYPICVWLLIRLIVPVFRMLLRLEHAIPLDSNEVSIARRRALALPRWATMLSCAGWIPGGLFFPAAISILAGPVSMVDFGHFLVSFTVSGMIAMTYSFFGVQYIVVRVLYSCLWSDASDLRRCASAELRPYHRTTQVFQVLAGLIPVVGAALLICSGPEQMTLSFRLLVTALLALGLAGFGLAVFLSGTLSRVISLFASVARPSLSGGQRLTQQHN